jgi:hypothetical protein
MFGRHEVARTQFPQSEEHNILDVTASASLSKSDCFNGYPILSSEGLSRSGFVPAQVMTRVKSGSPFHSLQGECTQQSVMTG